jgi:predicted unusual protein kinase regulating ubiquinone biosynthesis (AarF/ABC1/UbiB family)
MLIYISLLTFSLAGQQLAIRPDLVHPIVLKELQKLCDAVRTTMSEETAKEILESELGPEQVKKLQGLELVASASLGQVYKAELISSNDNGDQDIHKVAIKIQRPGMLKSFSLDLFLLQKYGDCVDSFTSIFTKQLPFHRDLFDSFSQGSYSVSFACMLFCFAECIF